MARLSDVASKRKECDVVQIKKDNCVTSINKKIMARGYLCTCCGKVMYPNRCDDNDSWNCYWRSVISNIGYILTCPTCSIRYNEDVEIYKKAEEQGWATVCPNGNLRNIHSTFLYLHVDKKEY